MQDDPETLVQGNSPDEHPIRAVLSKKPKRDYRTSIEAEYTPKGKLKPLGRWIGVTPAAKRMAKKLGRHAHRTEVTAIIETEEVNNAAEAGISRRNRSRAISAHNRERAQRERDLSVGATKEQRQARARHIRELTKLGKPLPLDINGFKPEEGGPIHTYFGRIKNEGYLGVELRAIRREQTGNALLSHGLYTHLTREW
jgi:hypothetical protein